MSVPGCQRRADGPLAVAQPALPRPRPLAVRRAHATHVRGAVPKDEHGNIIDPSWVLRSQSKHAFNIGAITRSSFLSIEGGQTLSTWDPSKVMKRIQMLGAYEQVGFTGAPTPRASSNPAPTPLWPTSTAGCGPLNAGGTGKKLDRLDG